MKVNVTLELDIDRRNFLKKYIGKSRGIRHQDYKSALLRYINDQIDQEAMRRTPSTDLAIEQV